MIDPATDPDYAAHIAHVHDHPADDLSRLVFADWLEQCDFWAAANYLRFATEFYGQHTVSDEKYQWQIAGGPWLPDSSYEAFPELPRLRGIGRGSW